MRRSRRDMGGVCMQLKRFLMEEDGVGVIEVVLILVENQRHPNLMCFV